MKLILGFLLVVFAAGQARAFEIDMPSRVHEGSAFLVKIKGEWREAHRWRVEAFGRQYDFFREGEDIVAILGVRIGNKLREEKVLLKKSDVDPSKTISEISKEIMVLDRHFTSVVFLSPPSKWDKKRYDAEQAEMSNIFSISSVFTSPIVFQNPLAAGCFQTTPFGQGRLDAKKNLLGRHWGIDCRAATGDPVYAVADGIVRLSKDLILGGNTVIVDHGFGAFSIYMHLSESFVRQDDNVKKGALVGRAGMSGRASGPHLHFGVKISGVDVDPLGFLKLRGAK